MDPRINTFCRSHFSRQEKRGFFFPVQPRTCHTGHRPKAKKHIDFDNFSNYHQNLICMCPQPAHIPGGARGGHGAAGGHGGAAPGGHNNFVTIAQFNAFQNQILNSINQINNNINQIIVNQNNQNNQINQINNQINNIINRLDNNNIN